MWTLLNGLGLGGNWLPALVSLILIPALYVVLAIDVHKEYGEVVKAAIDAKEVATADEKSKLLNEVADKLRVFDLEWWLVAAFGVLVVAIMGSGYLTDWSKLPTGGPGSSVPTYQCQLVAAGKLSCVIEPERAVTPIRTAMSLYATLVGVLVGFRLGWARLKLAQDLKRYYVFHHRTVSRAIRKRTA